MIDRKLLGCIEISIGHWSFKVRNDSSPWVSDLSQWSPFCGMCQCFASDLSRPEALSEVRVKIYDVLFATATVLNQRRSCYDAEGNPPPAATTNKSLRHHATEQDGPKTDCQRKLLVISLMRLTIYISHTDERFRKYAALKTSVLSGRIFVFSVRHSGQPFLPFFLP